MTAGPQTRGGVSRPVVFIDRDGTLIREVNWLHDPAQVELIPGAAAAVQQLAAAGWAVVLLTNQSVIARGLCDEAGLAGIHRHLADLLARGGAALDAIYFCPHHPGPMPESTRPDLIRPCACRKPGTALVTQAAAELGLDLTRAWLIGDTTGDIQTAQNAGLRSVLVQTGYGGRDGRYGAQATLTVASIREAVAAIGRADG